MPAFVFALLIAFSAQPVDVPPAMEAMGQLPATAGCSEWHACRELALAAAERGEYETFHDLAWRAVQTGPKNDRDLMFLLARAQALSGRPHDALVMLARLADMGASVDASGEEFSRTRQLPQWPEVEASLAAAAGGRAPSPATSSASRSTSASPSPTVAAAGRPTPDRSTAASPPSATATAATSAANLPVVRLASGPQPVRFSMRPFVVSGLGYDALSRRFVVGDRLGRKLVAVDEGTTPPIDLVRSDSAGFLDIAAVEIDGKRGDLWVASAGTSDGTGTLHRLQLVSGRPLRSFAVSVDQQPVKLVDLAVTTNGSVLVLDATAPQLLVLRPGGTALERAVRLDVTDAVSVTAGGEDGVAFVAHRDGISRVDLRTRRVSRLAFPASSAGISPTVPLDAIERIRRQGNALVIIQGDQTGSNGSGQILRMELNAGGTAITKVTRLEAPTPTAGQTFMTISSDELVYVTSHQTEFVVQRVPLP